MTPADRYTFAAAAALHDVQEIVDDAPDMLAVARDLVARGISVIPLDRPDDTWVTNPDDIGKTPAIKWKSLQGRLPTDAELRKWFGNGRKRNAAIVTGAISNLVVVDGDSAEGLAWMCAHLPLPPLRIKTAKGEHWPYRHPGVPVKNEVRIRTGDPAIKVDVRGDGGYVVAEGSLHATRVTYTRLGGEWPPVSELPVFDPAWMEPETPEPTPKVLPPTIPRGAQHHTLFREGCRLRWRGYAEKEIADVLWSLHKNRSEGPDVPREREDIDKIAASICKQYEPGQTAFVKYTKPAAKKDQIIPDHQGNIRLAVDFCGVELSYNLFTEQELIHESGAARPLDGAALQDFWLRIDRDHRFRPSLNFFGIVLSDLARRQSFHPVRDYLESLTWDGKPRINTWLVDYGGAVDMTTQSDADDSLSYLEAVSSIPLMAAVKRVLDPGCKYDEMLVIESAQGLNKSGALRALCPQDEWFSDDLPLNVGSKELIERTLGIWIVEASDLSGKRKTEIEQLKAMMSRQVDGPARMAYERKPVRRPRHFIIIGTTNSAEYLPDSTGARRFWPARIKKFNVEHLARDRDQLWAEAVARVTAGETIRMPETLWKVAAEHQEARREIDPWEAALRDLLDDPNVVTPGGDGRRRVTAEQLFIALNVDVARRDRPAQMRVSQIMQQFGFTRGNVWNADSKRTTAGYVENAKSSLGTGDEDET